MVLNSAQADASLTGLGPQSGVLIEVDDSSQVCVCQQVYCEGVIRNECTRMADEI